MFINLGLNWGFRLPEVGKWRSKSGLPPAGSWETEVEIRTSACPKLGNGGRFLYFRLGEAAGFLKSRTSRLPEGAAWVMAGPPMR